MRNLVPMMIAVAIVITVTLTSAATTMDLEYGDWTFSNMEFNETEAIGETLSGDDATCTVNGGTGDVSLTFTNANDNTEVGTATTSVETSGCETTVTGSAEATVGITDNTNTGSEA